MTPLSATDLRVGNWVYDEDDRKNRQIKSGDIVAAECFPEQCGLLPIVLTPEILEKATFKPIPSFTVMNSYILDIGRERYLSIGCVGTPNETVFLCCRDDSDTICLWNFDYDGRLYLHHLQNLIHALTGHELNIQLA